MAAHSEHDADHPPEDRYDHEVDTNILEAGEPESPLWLPIVGCGVFLVAGIVLLALSGGEEPESDTLPATSASVSAAPAEPAPPH